MTSLDVPHPSIPRLSLGDEIQVRHALRRNRLLATGLLALMIVIAAATRLEPSPGWVVQLARAGAEAGIIGGWLTGSRSLFSFATRSGFHFHTPPFYRATKIVLDAPLVPSSSATFSFPKSYSPN